MVGNKKGRKNKKRTDKSLGDVTINDFANSTICKNRQKKSQSSISTAVKQIVDTDDVAWDEKLDEFDDFDFIKQENEDGTTSVICMKNTSTTRRRRKTVSNSYDENNGEFGYDYPLDIWFLISEHIRPEDISCFAGICRSSLAVVSSAKFWFSIYKRYYKSVPNLPERLQPECMVRLYGLRACVIRALYFMYPPFLKRLKTITTFECDPYILIKRRCILMWHSKIKDQWLFYFKLKVDTTECRSHSNIPSQKPDLITMLEDVSANQDENCRILQVTCLNYVPTEYVLGLNLLSVSMTLSQGLRHHRLQLTFGPSFLCNSAGAALNASSILIIVMDPVINIRVLDWWHPMYPHSDKIMFN